MLLSAPTGIGDRDGEAFAAAKRFKNENPTKGTGHNDTVDAFRHAYASFRMSQQMGQRTAKWFMDAHEISSPNPWSETAMDLWNNAVGRELAADYNNAWREPYLVVR